MQNSTIEKEDKLLLIKELCSRLPYGVWIEYNGLRTRLRELRLVHLFNDTNSVQDIDAASDFFGDDTYIVIEKIRPILRPMNAMSEMEELELKNCISAVRRIEFLNSHHLDYNGLIEKGLAVKDEGNTYAI